MKKKEEVHAVRTLPACTPKAKKAAVNFGVADADANAKKNLVDAVQERVTVAGECAHKLVDTVGKFLSEFSVRFCALANLLCGATRAQSFFFFFCSVFCVLLLLRLAPILAFELNLYVIFL